MGDPGAVQPAYFGPQPLKEVVADLLGGELAERAALYPVHDQQRGPAPALITRSTRGTRTPARSAITAMRAWCSAARMTEAAGQVSPTLRSRANR